VFVRLLRVRHEELIRAPQAYLFQIASNLVYELRQREGCDVITFNSCLVDRASERLCDLTATELRNVFSKTYSQVCFRCMKNYSDEETRWHVRGGTRMRSNHLRSYSQEGGRI
jgi:DNA-directed RNA polymerase specialized sigma24 family protein